MSGASSRRKGHDFEQGLARWLRDTTGLDIRTARSITGGMQAGSDLVEISDGQPQRPLITGGFPIALELKNHGNLRLPQWMRQAHESAGTVALPFVIAKRHGVADPGSQWLISEVRTLAELLEP